MKSLKLIFALVCFSAVTLTSCSNDDDSGPSVAAELSGKWNYARTVTLLNNQSTSTEYTAHTAGCAKNYQEFAASGTIFKDVVVFKNPSNICTEAPEIGTYTRSGNNLTIVRPDPNNTSMTITENFEIIRLDNNELHYKSTSTTGGVELQVTRVFTRN